MIKTKAEILEQIKNKFSEDTSDETLSFIEDVSDTLTDLEGKATGQEDWKQKFEDNDKMWREKYKSRFFAGEEKPKSDLGGNDSDEDDDEDTPPQPKTYDDLFKEGDK